MNLLRIPFPLLPALLVLSCGDKKPPSTRSGEQPPVIAAVNYPLAYFAERLAGDFATIRFEAPPAADPAFWKPSDQEISRIQQADLILLNGATYAKWTTSAILPFEAVVDTSAAFSSEFIEIEGAVKHTHGADDAGHSHDGTAFTTWLDLGQAAAQAAAIAEALLEEFPEHSESITARHSALQSDLTDLDRAMEAAASRLKGAPLVASHPVYQYWARAYGLTVRSLYWEPEMELTDAALDDLKRLLGPDSDTRYFLWEGDPRPGHIESLGAMGLTSVVLTPCGNRPSSGDFLSVMEANIAALEAAVR